MLTFDMRKRARVMEARKHPAKRRASEAEGEEEGRVTRSRATSGFGGGLASGLG